MTTNAKLDSNISTTEPPYRISRSEFGKILRRNLVGIRKLYELELQDALKVILELIYAILSFVLITIPHKGYEKESREASCV